MIITESMIGVVDKSWDKLGAGDRVAEEKVLEEIFIAQLFSSSKVRNSKNRISNYFSEELYLLTWKQRQL